MKPEPNIPDDLRPLRLVPGYLISADGRVFRAKDRKAVRPLSLKEATRAAEGSIDFDRNRLSRQPLGPVPPERLVTTDIVEDVFIRPDGTTIQRTREIEVTQWVRLPSKREMEPLARGEAVAAFTSGPVPARGDTEAGWYRLEPDGAVVVFHGASLAAHERK